MGTIRTVTIAGAALVALFAQVPEPAKAQTVRCPGAPLQIAPGASNPCVAAPKTATKKSTAKAKTVTTTKTAAKAKAATKAKTAAKAERADKSGSKSATKRIVGKSGAGVKTATRPASGTKKAAAAAPTRTQAPAGKQAAKNRVVVRAVVPRPMAKPAAEADPPSAPTEVVLTANDHIMRGGDSISLLAKLPWWRNDSKQTIDYEIAEGENKVLVSVESWMSGNDGSAVHRISEAAFASTPPADAILVADASEVNDIDLASDFAPNLAANSLPPPFSPAFLYSLIALLGGAGAAVVSARYLFA